MRRPARSRPAVIGVTGSFGSGKSTVSRMFRKNGCVLVDADRLARACLGRGRLLRRRVIGAFGKQICDRQGELSRTRLARLVFSDAGARRKLNAFIHPEVTRLVRERIERHDAGCIVCDIPLLYETGLQALMDAVIVVSARPAVQIARIRKRRLLSERQIRARLHAQMPLEKKRRLADFVIDNNGTISETKKKVESIWKEVQPMIRKRRESR